MTTNHEEIPSSSRDRLFGAARGGAVSASNESGDQGSGAGERSPGPRSSLKNDDPFSRPGGFWNRKQVIYELARRDLLSIEGVGSDLFYDFHPKYHTPPHEKYGPIEGGGTNRGSCQRRSPS